MKKLFFTGLALAALFVLAGCGDSPMDVTMKWGNALADGDVNTANKYSTQRTHALNGLMAAACNTEKDKTEFKNNLAKLKKEGKVTINGDTATISAEGEKDGLTLTKVDGAWKVDVNKK